MECEKTGFNFAVKLSYSLTDKSNLPQNLKRDMIFSLHCFRSVFGDTGEVYPNPVLKKYALEAIIEKGSIPADMLDAPQKLTLYETVYNIVSMNTATDELRAAWFLIFPYVIALDAPHEQELYYKIRELIFTEAVFEKVLESRYSIYTADSVQELWALDMPNLIVDWMLPYIEYKNEKNAKGVSRDVERYQKWLASGRFADVFEGTEKLLDTFPDDETLLLVNIASRISLDKSVHKDDHQKLLQETVNLIDSVLERPTQKKAFFLYYCGLAYLGLKRVDEALDKFNECLDVCPNFESAHMMIRAIKEKLGKTEILS